MTTTPRELPDYTPRASWRADLIAALYVRGDYPMPAPDPHREISLAAGRDGSWHTLADERRVLRYTYPTLSAARRALAAALSDVAGDNPEIEQDAYAADIVEAVALDCSPAVAAELCRTELGWVPAGLRRLRPDLPRSRFI